MNYELFQMFQTNSTCVSHDIITIDFLLLIVPQQLKLNELLDSILRWIMLYLNCIDKSLPMFHINTIF